MSMTLRKYYAMASAESYGHLGMEIETEYAEDRSNAIYRNIPTGWTVKIDNSLRNHGLEFTTVGACRVDNKNAVIASLLSMLEKHTKTLNDSPRTSFHVHLNQADLFPVQIVTNVSAYWLIENILLEMCGKYRKGNLHCLSLKDAPGVIPELLSDINRTGYFSTLNQERLKYSGGNIATLRRFGTFEVRLMDGRLDLNRMILWTDILCDLAVTPCKNFKSPKELLDFVYDSIVLGKGDGTEVLTKLFSNESVIKHVAGLSKDLKGELLSSSRLLMPLAYGIHNWSKVYPSTTKKEVNTTRVGNGERTRGLRVVPAPRTAADPWEPVNTEAVAERVAIAQVQPAGTNAQINVVDDED